MKKTTYPPQTKPRTAATPTWNGALLWTALCPGLPDPSKPKDLAAEHAQAVRRVRGVLEED